jgi:SAM-dependent methyltransferase
VGAILILVGLGSMGLEGNIIVGLRFIFPGITLILFSSLGLLYSKISTQASVVRSYFDTVNKRYYLEAKSGESGYIPFDEIDSLGMRREIVSGNKSSTTYYIVYFVKKDGAWWDVYSYMSEGEALSKLKELQERVHFDRDEEFNLLETEKESNLFSFAEKENGVLFKWGEQVSMLYRVLGILAVVSFLSTFETDSFDCVLDIESIYANTTDGVRECIKEAHRVLKKNGVFFSMAFSTDCSNFGTGTKLEEHTYTDIPYGSPSTGVAHYFDEPELKEVIENTGFALETFEKKNVTRNNQSDVISQWMVYAKKQ